MEKEEYLSAYKKNEISANKHMSFALLFNAFLLFTVWFGYLFKLFTVSETTYRMTIIVIPIVVVILCIPTAFIKTKFMSKLRFKYFVLFLFVVAMSTLNIIMPKHAILGWAVCLALTGHYYSPKTTVIIFVLTLVMMLICLGFGTFYGEFDSNLISGELDKENQLIHNILLPDAYPDTGPGRYQYLSDLIKAGDNRFLKIFAEYYLGRALFVTLIFVVIISLNKRTLLLLNSEIKQSGENQKNKTELEVAKGIQLNTLPTEMVSSSDVEIVGELKAAKEVGGDLYDYLDIDENHVAVLIGDVSGKGVPAAMFMMKTITSFRDFATANKSPSQILKEINGSIFQGNKTNMFVTCFLAIIDKRNGKVVYSNAGHNPPLVGSNRNYHYLKCNAGFLLGCFKDAFVSDEEITLKPGESLVLYTDGVTEARNEAGDFFKEDKLLEVLNKKDYTCIVELHHNIKDEIANFVQDAPQSDDITLLTLKYRGNRYSYEEKDFPAKKENIGDMLSFINEFGKKHNLPEEFKDKLLIISETLFLNIINYGYENKNGNIFIRLLFDDDENEFVLTTVDLAKAYNPLEEEEPTADTNLESAGVGSQVMKSLMDDCAYDHINGKNILVLKKKI